MIYGFRRLSMAAKKSCTPKKMDLRTLFHVSRDDLQFFVIGPVICFVLYVFSTNSRDFSVWCKYLDAVDSLALAKYGTNSSIDPYKKFYGREMSKTVAPMMLHPLILRYMSFLLGNNMIRAQMVSTALFASCLPFVFNRFLRLYNLTSCPTFVTYLFCIFPASKMLHTSIPTSDALNLICILLSFIFYISDHPVLSIISCILASSVRMESLLLYPTFIACSIISLRGGSIVSYSLGLLASLAMIWKYEVDWKSLVYPGMFSPDSLSRRAFDGFLQLKNSISNLRAIHAYFGVWGPQILGTIMLFGVCTPLALFNSFFLFYTSHLKGGMIERISIPIDVFSILIGFRQLYENTNTRTAITITTVPYTIFALYYACGQINAWQNSARVWDTIV